MIEKKLDENCNEQLNLGTINYVTDRHIQVITFRLTEM